MIVLDVETSGIEPLQHSIVSLGALELEKPENRLYLECRVWEGASVMDESLSINGYTIEEVCDVNKMTERELIRNFLGWTETVEDKTLAGQNVSFDRDFVKAGCLRGGFSFPFAFRTIDTHSLCYMHMIQHKVKPPFDSKRGHSALDLDQVLRYVGIPAEPKPHNALTGALCHAEVIHRLLYGEQLLSEFADFPSPFSNASFAEQSWKVVK